jgi:hypothetical protein
MSTKRIEKISKTQYRESVVREEMSVVLDVKDLKKSLRLAYERFAEAEAERERRLSALRREMDEKVQKEVVLCQEIEEKLAHLKSLGIDDGSTVTKPKKTK